MQPVNCRISPTDREYLDRVILTGEIASYGHSLRYLIQNHRKSKRLIANLKTENTRLREQVRLYGEGRLGQEAQPQDVGFSKTAEKD